MDDDLGLSDTASVWKVRMDEEDDWHKSIHQHDVATQTDSHIHSDDAELIFTKLQELETLLKSLATPWWKKWVFW
jgi:hypothetical protein